MNIVLTRFLSFYESLFLTVQFGFRSSKGFNNIIYVIKKLQEISYFPNRKLYSGYVDPTEAYDNENMLWIQ